MVDAVAAPSTPSADAGSSVDASSSVDTGTDAGFDFMFGEVDDAAAPAPIEGTPEATPAPAPAPGTPPTGVEPVAPVPPVPPVAATPPVPPTPPTSQPGATAPSAQVPPPVDVNDPQAVVGFLSQNRAAVVQEVAQKLFQLSNEDIELLQTDAAAAVPKLLARAYVYAQMGFLSQLQRLMPAMMDRQSTEAKVHEANQQAFFAQWPQLNLKDHGDLIYRTAVIFRQMNPQATRDQLIDMTGRFVMHQLGIVATPAPAPKGNGAKRSTPPQGFVPAGSGPAGGLTQQQENPFGYMDFPG